MSKPMNVKSCHFGKNAIASCVALGALAVHAALVSLYLMPDNPLKARLATTGMTYVHLLWNQNWHLFSPDPPTFTHRLHVKCEKADGGASPWLDPTAPVIEAGFRRLVGPDPKLRYVYVGINDNLVDELGRLGGACKGLENDGPRHEECLRKQSPRATAETSGAFLRSPAYDVAHRFGVAVCREWLGAEAGALAKVRLRYGKYHVHGFSRRDAIGTSPYSKIEYFEYPHREVL